ncbi:MAG: cytochrome C [Burkholderiales bacterium PBB5]|nr:MAG: cytochrome C [Burkholderiales bacterium PBB5]
MTRPLTSLLAAGLLAGGLAQAQPAPTIAAAAAVARGQQLYEARCTGCHSVDANRTGPLHRGVLGRRAGSVAGYAYSPALAGSGLVWTRENLLRWLAGPEALVPGQKMGASLRSEADRADVVAFLASLSP